MRYSELLFGLCSPNARETNGVESWDGRRSWTPRRSAGSRALQLCFLICNETEQNKNERTQ